MPRPALIAAAFLLALGLSVCSQQAPSEIPEDVILACLRLAACSNNGLTTTGCLVSATRERVVTGSYSSATVSCIVHADSCEALRGCSGSTHACLSDGIGGFSCGAGESCIEGISGARYCSPGHCSGGDPSPRCDGRVQIKCSDGVLLHRDCADFGEGVTCQEGRCRGTGAFCSLDRCDGDLLVPCVGLRYASPRACPSDLFPQSCVSAFEDGTWGRCLVPRDSECDLYSFRDYCRDSTLVYCDGRIREVSCRKEFNGCSDDGIASACRW